MDLEQARETQGRASWLLRLSGELEAWYEGASRYNPTREDIIEIITATLDDMEGSNARR